MNYIKAAIIALLIFSCGIAVHFFSGKHSHDEGYAALRHFETGDYEKAIIDLNKMRSRLPANRYYLYRAYIARRQNQFEESQQFLNKALQLKAAANDPKFDLEVIDNKILNCYLMRDPAGMRQLLADKEADSPLNHEWFCFLKGVERYQVADYKEALKNWRNGVPRSFYSLWMKVDFEAEFSPFWLEISLARSEIELGNGLLVREKLLKEEKDRSAEEKDSIQFLIGLSYIKEGKSYPDEQIIAYHKAGIAQLSSLPSIHSDAIIQVLRRDASFLLAKQQFADLSYYIEAFEHWGLKGELDAIADELIGGPESFQAVQKAAAVLNQMVGNGYFKDIFVNKLLHQINTSVEEGSPNEAQGYWKIVSALNNFSAERRDQLLHLLGSQVLNSLSDDSEELNKTKSYLAVWTLGDQDRQHRYRFGLKLIDEAESIWSDAQQEEKALAVFRLARTLILPSDMEGFQEYLEKSVRRLYLKAWRHDHSRGIKSALHAAKEFNLQMPVIDSSELANSLADAEYLFAKGNYTQAKSKALCVLEMNNNDKLAHWLAGFAEFYQGNYEKAMKQLEASEKNDKATSKALAISRLITASSPLNENQIYVQEDWNEEDFLRIGFGLAARDKPQESLLWFDKVAPQNLEAQTGTAYAYFAVGAFDKAARYFAQLKSPYKELEGMQSIAVESLIANGQIDLAEEILVEMLKSKSGYCSENFSMPFRAFKRKKLDLIDKHYVAALFFSKIKPQPEKALLYFKKLKSLPPHLLVLKAEMAIQAKLPSEAIEDLKNALKHAETDKQRFYLFSRLAELLNDTGFKLDAVSYYKQAIELDPLNKRLLISYVEVLKKIRRFDLAYEQLAPLQAKQNLSASEKTLFIEVLIGLNRFDEASRLLRDTLEETALPPLTKFKLLYFANLLQDGAYTRLSLETNEQELDNEERKKYIQFLIQQGDINEAKQLAKEFGQDLALLTRIALIENSIDDRLEKAKQLMASSHNGIIQAKFQLNELSKEYPNIPEICQLQGNAYFLLGDLTGAKQALRDTIQLDPSNVEAYKVMALISLNENELENAIEMAEKALRFKPHDHDALVILEHALKNPEERKSDVYKMLQKYDREKTH